MRGLKTVVSSQTVVHQKLLYVENELFSKVVDESHCVSELNVNGVVMYHYLRSKDFYSRLAVQCF